MSKRAWSAVARPSLWSSCRPFPILAGALAFALGLSGPALGSSGGRPADAERPSATASSALPVRTVTVGAVSKEGKAVPGLTPDEVTLTEDGKNRQVVAIDPEERPLEVALILDSSAQMGQDYRSVLVDSAMAFWRAVPPEARLSIWTSGGRPSKIVGLDAPQAKGDDLLRQVAAALKNYALDTIVDACKELAQSKAPRRAIVIVTHTDIEASKTLIEKAYDEIARARVVPFIILVKRGPAPNQLWDTESIFGQMAAGYGGAHHTALSSLASRKLLEWTAADFASQYRIRYTSDAKEPTHPEVKVKRKGTTVSVRVGVSQPAP